MDEGDLFSALTVAGYDVAIGVRCVWSSTRRPLLWNGSVCDAKGDTLRVLDPGALPFDVVRVLRDLGVLADGSRKPLNVVTMDDVRRFCGRSEVSRG